MFIEQPAIYLRWLYPKAYWRMDRHEKAVYLTFDDGPIPEATPFILDILKTFDAKATFFMVGDNVRKHPELYERILAEGHQGGTIPTTTSRDFPIRSRSTATMSKRPMPISTPVLFVRHMGGCASDSMPGSVVNTRS